MKLIELFADKLLTTPLMEMAMERATVVAHIASFERKLNEHIIKYCFFEDQARKQWLSEISTFIEEINDVFLKPKNRKLDKQVYYDKLFEDFYGHGDSTVERIIKKFVKEDYSKTSRSGLSVWQVHWCMKQFYEWLCPLIATKEYSELINENQFILQNKLDELKEKASHLH